MTRYGFGSTEIHKADLRGRLIGGSRGVAGTTTGMTLDAVSVSVNDAAAAVAPLITDTRAQLPPTLPREHGDENPTSVTYLKSALGLRLSRETF